MGETLRSYGTLSMFLVEWENPIKLHGWSVLTVLRDGRSTKRTVFLMSWSSVSAVWTSSWGKSPGHCLWWLGQGGTAPDLACCAFMISQISQWTVLGVYIHTVYGISDLRHLWPGMSHTACSTAFQMLNSYWDDKFSITWRNFQTLLVIGTTAAARIKKVKR